MFLCGCFCCGVFFFKQKPAYEMRISDWSSDVCSSDLAATWARWRRGSPAGHDPAGAASAAPARTTAVQRQDESMGRQYKVAVVGATGAVGEVMLSVLAERGFPVGEIVALASERSAGGYVAFGDEEVLVHDLASFDPAGVDIALFSAGGAVSKEYAPKFAAAGAVVIDNSSAFRQDADVPLVVSEVNPEARSEEHTSELQSLMRISY